MPMRGKVIGHIDMDCFYVQVEQVRDPSLRDVPTAVVQYNPFGDLSTVGPDDNRRVDTNGSLIAVSYEARDAGVKRSMRAHEAKKTCPELQLVQVPVAHGKADINLYRKAGERVVSVLSRRYKCVVEKASIDEVFLDLTEEASRLLSECIDFQTEIVDRLRTNDFCIAGPSDASPTSRLPPVRSHTDSAAVMEDLLQFDRSHFDSAPYSLDNRISGSRMSVSDTPFPTDDVDDELTASSFASTVIGDDSCSSSRLCLGPSADTSSTSVALDEFNTLPFVSSEDRWPFNKTDWGGTDDDEDDSAALRGDKLLLCGAVLVQRLRADVLQELNYTCSGGVAHTKMLAKIASALNKPNKQTIVPSRCVSSLMSTLPLSRLKGFGGKLGEALRNDFNVKVVGDILAIGEAGLSTKYDRAQCNWILQAASGNLDEQVVPRTLPNIISCGKTYRGATGLPLSGLTDGAVLQWLVELSTELLERLEEAREGYGRIAKLIGVTYHLHQDSIFRRDQDRSTRGSPTKDRFTISLSKNGPLPRQSTAQSLANVFLKMMTSALEKSPKVGTTATVSTSSTMAASTQSCASGSDHWKIVSIFLHASSFDTLASEKQKISHFFASHRNGHRKGQVGNSNDTTDRDLMMGAENMSSPLPPLHTTTTAVNSVREDLVLSETEGTPQLELSTDNRFDVSCEGNKQLGQDQARTDIVTMISSHHSNQDETRILSEDKISERVTSVVSNSPCGERDHRIASCALVEHAGNGSKEVPSREMIPSYISEFKRDGPCLSSTAAISAPMGTSTRTTCENVGSCSDGGIDMNVLRVLPVDMQKELIRHYKLDDTLLHPSVGDNDTAEDIKSKQEEHFHRDYMHHDYDNDPLAASVESEGVKRRRLMSGHGGTSDDNSPIRVGRNETVSSQISDRLRRKAGMHKYFTSKPSK